MGTTYLFTCPQCAYRAKCSDRRDCGMVTVIHPFVCLDCRRLMDVQIGENGRVYDRDALPSGREHDFYRCGRCGSANIRKWNIVRRTCPRCGGKMTKSSGFVMQWD